MSWRGAVKSFMSSGAFISMIGGIGASGTYVIYTDSTRYSKMSSTFARGNILPPLTDNAYEVTYTSRPTAEATLREILAPTFSNEYFVVHGPVGVGKTRLIAELTQEMIASRGSKNLGAPVYVLATQGRNFAETLADAVNFHFDEHVSFRFFLNYALGIRSIPSKDDDNRIVRVLDAIEKASFEYLTKTGRPLVLVIDGLDDIARRSPTTVKMIQTKAKLWADTNSVKVVFVCNTEDTELLLQSNSSNWSRASSPIALRDLSKDETIQFLKSGALMEIKRSSNVDEVSSERTEGMSSELAEKVYDLFGGRIRHLVLIKGNWLRGKDLDEIFQDLMEREREKFVSVSNHCAAWKAIGLIRNFVSERSIDVDQIDEALNKSNIIGNQADGSNLKKSSEGIRDTKNVVKPNFNSKDVTTNATKASASNKVKGSQKSVSSENSCESNSDDHNDSDCIHLFMNDSEGSGYLLSKLTKKTSPEVVQGLVKAGLLRCERSRLGVIVKFESRLTENVVNDLERTYRTYKAQKKQNPTDS